MDPVDLVRAELGDGPISTSPRPGAIPVGRGGSRSGCSMSTVGSSSPDAGPEGLAGEPGRRPPAWSSISSGTPIATFRPGPPSITDPDLRRQVLIHPSAAWYPGPGDG